MLTSGLHCMASPPIEIHVDPSARPLAFRSPVSIPLHWQEKDLLRDEALGILEKFPHGEARQWCHGMGTIAASTLSWLSLSKENVALTTLFFTTRGWKITGDAVSNSLPLSDGLASFSIPTSFNSLSKLWILPDLEFLSRLLSRFPSTSMLSETFLSLIA